MTGSIRRPEVGDRVRKLADIHGTTIAWFIVTRVAFNPDGDCRNILALEYSHGVDGTLCVHSTTTALDDDGHDLHGHVVDYEAAASSR